MSERVSDQCECVWCVLPYMYIRTYVRTYFRLGACNMYVRML